MEKPLKTKSIFFCACDGTNSLEDLAKLSVIRRDKRLRVVV